MNKSRLFGIPTLVFLVLALLVGTVLAAAPEPDVTNVYWDGSGEQVQGAKSQLRRMDDGAAFHINTKGLDNGSIYTVWAAIFNNPDACSDGECGPDDIPANIVAAEISVIYAGSFQVNNDAGIGNVDGMISNDSDDQVFFGPQLANPMGAEIHFVVRDHGAPQDGLEYKQSSTFGGGCDNVPAGHPGYIAAVVGTYACEDVQFVIHTP